MPSSDKTNELFWLEYGQAFADKIGKFGDSTSLFLATEAQKGPIASDNIPDEYTNAGIFAVGDSLLATDNPFYVPSALHSYREALDTYLSWVDLGGKPNPALDDALLSAKKDQEAAQARYRTEMKKAQEQYKEEFEMELTSQKFYEYVNSGRVPAYTAAKQQLANIGQTIYQIQSRIAGPLANTINQDRAKLANASSNDNQMPGYNMRAAFGDYLSPREISRRLDKGEKVPEPATILVPLYSAPTYKKTVEGAMRKSEGDYDVPVKLSVTVDTSKSTRDYTFNSATGGANIGATLGGWFSFNVGGSHSEESTNLETGSETSSVKIDIRYDELVAVPIQPGMWNVDVSKYKLQADAPKDVKQLARTSQFVVATRLGYDITVSSSIASSIDTGLKKTTSGSGSISIFGIPISLGGGGSSTTEKQTHEAKWDSASRTFRVTPVQNNGFATVIGVVGEKFNIL